MENEIIAKAIQLKREGIALTEKNKESKEVRLLLRDMKKMTLGNDGVL